MRTRWLADWAVPVSRAGGLLNTAKQECRLGRASRTAATMLGMTSIVNDSVPHRRLGGEEFSVRRGD